MASALEATAANTANAISRPTRLTRAIALRHVDPTPGPTPDVERWRIGILNEYLPNLRDTYTPGSPGPPTALQDELASSLYLIRNKSFDEIKSGGEAGNSACQIALFYIYLRGRGVPVNNEEAIRWLTRAANSGNIAANGMLGDSYHLGRDIPKDDVEARRYLATAAALGDPNAQYDLGLFYENGLGGVAMNLETAIELYYNSARRGFISSINALNDIGIVRRNPTALYTIGKLYENGEIYGELENRHRRDAVYLNIAIDLYRQAAELGSRDAITALSLLGENVAGGRRRSKHRKTRSKRRRTVKKHF